MTRKKTNHAALRQSVESRIVASAGEVGVTNVKDSADAGRGSLGERRLQSRFNDEMTSCDYPNAVVEQSPSRREIGGLQAASCVTAPLLATR